jgi:peptidoglycan/LPS O-acetylase OafA/YrhL
MSSLRYRPEIDGLRAVAVMSVVLYHANIPGISGGFIGVDVFFVISGYLITSIINREIVESSFSILRFYERRARRILPALFAMVTFTILLAPFVLLPSEFQDFPEQVLGTLLFVANIVYWRQSGYFSDAADSNLLLHTWSLGVEEQFYIFAPLLLMFLFRYLRGRQGTAIALFTLVSLALCIALTPRFPSPTFYLLPTRAWELGIGAVIALGVVPDIHSQKLREFLSGIGILFVVVPVFTFSSEMNFPGYAAVVPVLGAALILHCGRQTNVGSFLSFRVMVGVGLISYSLYLWHWPIFVAASLQGVPSTLLNACLLCIAAFLIAWLSWKYIETPLRSPDMFSTKRLWNYSGGFFGSLLTVALIFYTLNGWPERFDQSVLAYAKASDDISPLRSSCHMGGGLKKPDEFCIIGADEDKDEIFVWGDSHGVELSYALSSYYRVHSITYSSCPPVVGIDKPIRPECGKHNEIVHRFFLEQSKPVKIVLAAYFEDNIENHEFHLNLIDTIKSLQHAGHDIILVAPTPSPGTSLPKYLARGGMPFIHANKDRSNSPAVQSLLSDVATSTHVDIVYPRDSICGEEICNLLIDGYPILFDDNHPSLHMANRTAALIFGKYES